MSANPPNQDRRQCAARNTRQARQERTTKFVLRRHGLVRRPHLLHRGPPLSEQLSQEPVSQSGSHARGHKGMLSCDHRGTETLPHIILKTTQLFSQPINVLMRATLQLGTRETAEILKWVIGARITLSSRHADHPPPSFFKNSAMSANPPHTTTTPTSRWPRPSGKLSGRTS